MNVHPAADLFPLMADADLSALVEDIRKHGLRDAIETLNGELLDGRNRLRACELAGVAPRFVEVSLNGDSPTEYVVSRNLHRRHLTTAQRAALAVELLPHLESEARERMSAGGKGSPISDDLMGRSDEKAAEIVGVGRSTVASVKAIQQRDPNIVDRMRSGEIPTVAAAGRAVGWQRANGGSARGGRPGLVPGGVASDGKETPAIYYGKGDRFDESTEPLRRYLRAWRKRDYSFPHVNPKEARRRLTVLDELTHGLEQTRRDIEGRSATARLSL